MGEVIKNRYEFVVLFDVENGNPNGDPDAGNAPRVDAESGYGYVTDVCLKRKIRNYVELVKEGEEGYNILIKPDRSLNAKFTEAYKELGLTSTKKDSREKKADDMVKARDYMCKNYFDVRTFGAVMSTGDNPCGIVRGPVQINFARSISPVEPQDIAITRQARTTDEIGRASAGVGGPAQRGAPPARTMVLPEANPWRKAEFSSALQMKSKGSRAKCALRGTHPHRRVPGALQGVSARTPWNRRTANRADEKAVVP